MMSPEREAEIREYWYGVQGEKEVLELLEEIDRLRGDLKAGSTQIDGLLYAVDKTEKERDSLKIINDQDLCRIERLMIERDLIQAENERFRRDYDKHDLILENDRLKARVIKLRSVVQWCIGMLEGMGVRGTYPKQALSQDDEAEKK